MLFDRIIWDLDDDPEGNVYHCAEHGVTPEEVEEVFRKRHGCGHKPLVRAARAFGDTPPVGT